MGIELLSNCTLRSLKDWDCGRVTATRKLPWAAPASGSVLVRKRLATI
jgi:hypothetical protein